MCGSLRIKTLHPSYIPLFSLTQPHNLWSQVGGGGGLLVKARLTSVNFCNIDFAAQFTFLHIDPYSTATLGEIDGGC